MSIVHSIVSIVVKKRIATTSRQGMSEWNTFKVNSLYFHDHFSVVNRIRVHLRDPMTNRLVIISK